MKLNNRRSLPSECFGWSNSGSDSYLAMSQTEVAKVLGITKQAVRRIERNALAKLRKAFFAELREVNPIMAREFRASELSRLTAKPRNAMVEA